MDPLDLHLPADPTALADLRRSVREWLASLEIVEQDVAAIVAACSEIAAAAIEAGPTEVRGALAGGDVVVRISGTAGWDVESHPARYVAALLVDDVSIESREHVSLTLRKSVNFGLRERRDL